MEEDVDPLFSVSGGVFVLGLSLSRVRPYLVRLSVEAPTKLAQCPSLC